MNNFEMDTSKIIQTWGFKGYPVRPPARMPITINRLLKQLYATCPAPEYHIRPMWAVTWWSLMFYPIEGEKHFDDNGQPTKEGWIKHFVYLCLN